MVTGLPDRGEPGRMVRGRRAGTPIPARESPLSGDGSPTRGTHTETRKMMGLAEQNIWQFHTAIGEADGRALPPLESERGGGAGPALGAPSEWGQQPPGEDTRENT